MKKMILLAVLSSSVFVSYAQNLDWAKKINSEFVTVQKSTTNRAGDLIVVGTFKNAVDFNPSPSRATYLTSSGPLEDIFIAKYLKTGALAWVKKIGNTKKESVSDIAITENGSDNIFIAGKIEGVVDFNPGSSVNNMGIAGTHKTFIAKYDGSTGRYIDVHSFSDKISIDYLVSFRGDLIVAGTFEGTADFSPSFWVTNLVAHSKDVFVAEYSTTGTCIWAKNFGNSNESFVTGLAVDGASNVYVTGRFNGTVDFNPSSHFAFLTSTGGTSDVFFAKFDGDGRFRFARAITGTGNVSSYGIQVDNTGNIFVAGKFNAVIDANPASAVNNLTSASSSTYDLFLAKYSPSGSYIWSTRFGNANNEIPQPFQLDANQGILLHGNFLGTVDFNPNAATYNLTSSSNTVTDAFVVRIKNNGSFDWAFKIGNAAEEYTFDITASPRHDHFYITGKFWGTVNFNPTANSRSLTATGQDMYIAKYDLSTSSLVAENTQAGKKQTEEVLLDKSVSKAITLSPNPATDFIKITYSENSANEHQFIRIFDINGREVLNNSYSVSQENSGSQIDISNLKQGLYILTIQQGEHIIREKFIKQ